LCPPKNNGRGNGVVSEKGTDKKTMLVTRPAIRAGRKAPRQKAIKGQRRYIKKRPIQGGR